jgi:hypothetical protein
MGVMFTRPEVNAIAARRVSMSDIEVFMQGEGISHITLVRVHREAQVRALIDMARVHGFPDDPEAGETVVQLEDADAVLALDATLDEAGVGHRSRVHVHRCRTVEVTVTYNNEDKAHQFPPSMTIERVKEWATSAEAFTLSPVDATEHALQISGTSERPHDDVHIGALVGARNCALHLDLVAKRRIEG